MKKYIVTCFAFISLSFAWGQAYPRFDANSEIKFNMGVFLVNTTVEGSYEYYLNEDTSLGGTIYFSNDPTNYNGNFGIGPNFRAYFGYAPRSGFFAEAFMLYYTGEDDIVETDLGTRNYDYDTTALGLGMGAKWVTRSQRFSLELNGGLGRNINPEDFQSVFMYRAGLSVGFRF